MASTTRETLDMSRETTESPATSVIRGNVPADELNLLDHLRVLLKYRRMIFLVCFLAMSVTGVVSFVWPPSYVAIASVTPPRESSGVDSGLGMGLLGGTGASLLRQVMDVSSVADMYVGILESRVVTDAIIDRFDLVKVYEKGPLRFKARRKLQNNTKIKISEEGILYITVEDADPNRAAAMANAYVEELDRLNKKLSAGQTTSKRVFLETRLRDMEANLGRQDIPTREEQIQEMLYELLMRELEIAKIEEAKSMPTIQVLDTAVPPERRKPKGTIFKAALAGIVAFVLMVFVAFGREYWTACAMASRTSSVPVWGGQDVSRQPSSRTGAGKSRVAAVMERRSRSDKPDSKPVEIS